MKGLRKGKQFEVYGVQGGISTAITLPVGFNTEKDRCPMVILMHGFMASKRFYPISRLAKSLADAGIGTIAFDFNAHGKSEGKFVDMTLANELSDAQAIFDYVVRLPYVTRIGLAGHSQGGVIAGMLAGLLENGREKPVCMALLAPAAVLKDDAIAGQCMGKRYDASNPPEYVKVFFHKLGREFILGAQKTPIYEIAARYTGKVFILHGRKDKIVPYAYSEKYHSVYANSTLCLLEKEGHMLNKCKADVLVPVTEFFKDNLL